MKLGFGLLVCALFLIYAALFIFGVAYFRMGRDGAFKQLWYPRYVIFMALAFCLLFLLPLPDFGMPTLPGRPAAVAENDPMLGFDTSEIAFALVFVPLAAFKAWRNIRTTRFCTACGTMHRQRIFSTVKFCRKCGAELPGIIRS